MRIDVDYKHHPAFAPLLLRQRGRDKGIFSASVGDTLLQEIGALNVQAQIEFCR
jgi:hypothetical protein